MRWVRSARSSRDHGPPRARPDGPGFEGQTPRRRQPVSHAFVEGKGVRRDRIAPRAEVHRPLGRLGSPSSPRVAGAMGPGVPQVPGDVESRGRRLARERVRQPNVENVRSRAFIGRPRTAATRSGWSTEARPLDLAHPRCLGRRTMSSTCSRADVASASVGEATLRAEHGCHSQDVATLRRAHRGGCRSRHPARVGRRRVAGSTSTTRSPWPPRRRCRAGATTQACVERVALVRVGSGAGAVARAGAGPNDLSSSLRPTSSRPSRRSSDARAPPRIRSRVRATGGDAAPGRTDEQREQGTGSGLGLVGGDGDRWAMRPALASSRAWASSMASTRGSSRAGTEHEPDRGQVALGVVTPPTTGRAAVEGGRPGPGEQAERPHVVLGQVAAVGPHPPRPAAGPGRSAPAPAEASPRSRSRRAPESRAVAALDPAARRRCDLPTPGVPRTIPTRGWPASAASSQRPTSASSARATDRRRAGRRCLAVTHHAHDRPRSPLSRTSAPYSQHRPRDPAITPGRSLLRRAAPSAIRTPPSRRRV